MGTETGNWIISEKPYSQVADTIVREWCLSSPSKCNSRSDTPRERKFYLTGLQVCSLERWESGYNYTRMSLVVSYPITLYGRDASSVPFFVNGASLLDRQPCTQSVFSRTRIASRAAHFTISRKSPHISHFTCPFEVRLQLCHYHALVSHSALGLRNGLRHMAISTQ